MKFLAIFLLSVLIAPFSYGQIMESKKAMSQGDMNALVVTLPDTEVKVVEKEWEKFMKDHKAKVRGIKKSDEVFSDDAKLESISNNTVDVYSLVIQSGDDTKLSVWFDLGGAYLNSGDYPDKYANAKKLLHDFSGIVSKTYIANMLQVEEKKMKDLEGNLKDIDKSQENSERDIIKYQEKIEEEKANIETAKSNRVQAQKDIDVQKGVVRKVKDQLNN